MATNVDLRDPEGWFLTCLLEHCGWEERASLCQLNSQWRAKTSGSPVYWKQLSNALSRESRLYVTPHVHTVQDWKALFMDMWRMRTIWEQDEEAPPVTEEAPEAEEDASTPPEAAAVGASSVLDLRFSIRVCTRFKPLEHEAAKHAAKHVVLPFHQRIQMIKARGQSSADMTTSEAARVLMQEMGRGEEAGRDPWDGAALPESSEEGGDGGGAAKGPSEAAAAGSVRAAKDHKASILSMTEGIGGSVLAVAPGCGLRQFDFDAVLGGGHGQLSVFDSAAVPLVSDFINGFNGTILVYGQTGSGKTYTMFGPATEGGHTCLSGKDRGVVPRVCEEVLAAIESRREQGVEGELSMSYVEVFGQEVFDLLRGGDRVGQSRVAGQRYVLDGGCESAVGSLEEVGRLLDAGEAQKRKAATAMNERSTRAHALVVLSLRQTVTTTTLGGRRTVAAGDPSDATATTVTSHLFLADLGGSEQLGKSMANEGLQGIGKDGATWEEYYAARVRLVEAASINQGLFALKKCIDALNDKSPYVPYQDSKLTQLLSGALGGSSRTTVVVTGSLDPAHAVETVQALRFGERCSNVQNRARLTGASLRAAVEALTAEIEALEDDIRTKERWEDRRAVRRDAVDGDEVYTVSVLTGAEAERERLEELLSRRRELLGEPEPVGDYRPNSNKSEEGVISCGGSSFGAEAAEVALGLTNGLAAVNVGAC